MAELDILFGFKDKEEEVISKILSSVRSPGNVVSYAERTTKESIKEYLQNNEKCCHAVLRECMGAESFTAEELAELTDTRDINIVVIIEKEHKGTKFVDTLYAAGITSAIMVGKKSGATPGQIAELLLHKRNRKQARGYYGIKTKTMKIDILTYPDYLKNYSFLMNDQYGVNRIERLLTISKKSTPKQMAEFVQKLPVTVRKELQTYEEFWILIDSLRRYGINITATKPEMLKRGLTKEEFQRATERDTKKIKGMAGPKPVRHTTSNSSYPITEARKDYSEEEPVVENEIVSGENETKQTAIDVPMFDASENYFVEEMQVPKATVPKKKTPAPQAPRRETSTPMAQAAKGTKLELVEDGQSKKAFKKKKKKYGVNWKLVILTIVIGGLLLGLWYYLVYVLRIATIFLN